MMSSLNHAANNARIERGTLRRAAMYGASIAAAGVLREWEQTRFQTIARQHPEQSFCVSVCEQIDSGRPVSAKQAGVLMKLATINGWEIPTL